MNHFSYDVMWKEKIRELQKEGLRSQSVHGSRARKSSLLIGLSKLILFLSAIGILQLLLP